MSFGIQQPDKLYTTYLDIHAKGGAYTAALEENALRQAIKQMAEPELITLITQMGMTKQILKRLEDKKRRTKKEDVSDDDNIGELTEDAKGGDVLSAALRKSVKIQLDRIAKKARDGAEYQAGVLKLVKEFSEGVSKSLKIDRKQAEEIVQFVIDELEGKNASLRNLRALKRAMGRNE